VWATDRLPCRREWYGGRTVRLSPRIASGDPEITAWSCGPTAIRPGERRPDGGSGARCGFPQRSLPSTRAGAGGGRLTCRVLVGGLLPATTIVHFTETAARQPGRAHDHCPARQRPANPSASPSCRATASTKRAECLSPDDLEDEHAPADRKLSFVLHLGDFIYEVVEYPDRCRTAIRAPSTTLAAFLTAARWAFPCADQPRRLSPCLRAHIDDPDIQDAARAFSVRLHRRQSRILVARLAELHRIRGKIEPAQPLRVAANQAWWNTSRRASARPRAPGLGPVRPAGGDERADRHVGRSWFAPRPTTAPPSAA